jgi:hypothetical protein
MPLIPPTSRLCICETTLSRKSLVLIFVPTSLNFNSMTIVSSKSRVLITYPISNCLISLTTISKPFKTSPTLKKSKNSSFSATKSKKYPSPYHQIQNLDFPELEMLELGSNKIKKIENLEGVPNIKSLFLGKNKIETIENLECLKNIEQIALGVIFIDIKAQ